MKRAILTSVLVLVGLVIISNPAGAISKRRLRGRVATLETAAPSSTVGWADSIAAVRVAVGKITDDTTSWKTTASRFAAAIDSGKPNAGADTLWLFKGNSIYFVKKSY
jgi:hypothetical protein